MTFQPQVGNRSTSPDFTAGPTLGHVRADTGPGGLSHRSASFRRSSRFRCRAIGLCRLRLNRRSCIAAIESQGIIVLIRIATQGATIARSTSASLRKPPFRSGL